MKKLIACAALAMLFACTPEVQHDPSTNEEGNKVTGITLDRNSVTIKEGESVTLVATVKPDNAENKNVSWSSTDVSIVSVDNNGKLTGIKAGSATVTAKTEEGEKTASCNVIVEPNMAPSVTVSADNVSAISVVLAGKANLGPDSIVASDLEIGFQYSTYAGILPSNSTAIVATNADANYNYSAPIFGLDPATQYYYRSYARQNGQVSYGETKSFTTKELSTLISTLEATEIEAQSAILNGMVDLTDLSVVFKDMEYSCGFSWSASESDLTQDSNSCADLVGGGISGHTYSATLTTLSPCKQYWYRSYVSIDLDDILFPQKYYGEVQSFTTAYPTPEAIDLGLSVKWASCNLGAANPEDFGDYFAWGEIEPKSDYSWTTYKWCNGSENSLTKYNTDSSYGVVDNKTVLDIADDAANANIGGKWRIPTKAEWTELWTECDWIDDTCNGVSGCWITGPNWNKIFLPISSYYYGTTFSDYDIGYRGYYWTSSLSSSRPDMASGMVFYPWHSIYRENEWRQHGCPIRPVTK